MSASSSGTDVDVVSDAILPSCASPSAISARAAVPALARRLADHEPLLRGHAAWALGRIRTPAARQALDRAWLNEADPDTRIEISLALDDAP